MMFGLTPAHLWTAGIGALVISASSGFAGWKVRDLAADAAWSARDARDAEAATLAESTGRAVERTHTDIGAKVGVKAAVAAARVRVVTRDIIKEIPVYVPLPRVPDAGVPVGFLRIHDAAAQGVLPSPDPAGRAVDAPSGVALATVAGAVVENYGTCHLYRARVTAWETWWQEVSAAWPAG